MARKPILEGGKRDEIIDTAMELFFEHGYEATSVRMIMGKVGGEIGMFYHYFKSKDMLFDQVVDRFFLNYQKSFETLISGCDTPEEFADRFLPVYSRSMDEFGRIRENMHWSIQLSMYSRTLTALLPVIEEIVKRWDIQTVTPTAMLARQLLYGLSGTLHCPVFEDMDQEDKKRSILDLIYRLIG
ncbi:MAG: TetR/AcrR family transcriptional regulator [Oscillospiraceae bacterium]|nr:TetR/AcrR family transcriptional regulator [Oscillospiraceae bacterium]